MKQTGFVAHNNKHTHIFCAPLWCNLSLVINFRWCLLRRSASAGQPTHSSLSVCFFLLPLLFSLFPLSLSDPPPPHLSSSRIYARIWGVTRKGGEWTDVVKQRKGRKAVIPFPTCLKNWKQWRSLICHLRHKVHSASDKPTLRFEYESLVLPERSRKGGDASAWGKPDNWTLSRVAISSGYLRWYLKKKILAQLQIKTDIRLGPCHVRHLKVDLLRQRNEPAGHVSHPGRRRWYHTTLLITPPWPYLQTATWLLDGWLGLPFAHLPTKTHFPCSFSRNLCFCWSTHSSILICIHPLQKENTKWNLHHLMLSSVPGTRRPSWLLHPWRLWSHLH